jgi:hypothetical protein
MRFWLRLKLDGKGFFQTLEKQYRGGLKEGGLHEKNHFF